MLEHTFALLDPWRGSLPEQDSSPPERWQITCHVFVGSCWSYKTWKDTTTVVLFDNPINKPTNTTDNNIVHKNSCPRTCKLPDRKIFILSNHKSLSVLGPGLGLLEARGVLGDWCGEGEEGERARGFWWTYPDPPYLTLHCFTLPYLTTYLTLPYLTRAVESDFRKSNKSRMPKSF